MHPVYLLIGQSGAGKGTQVTLLKQSLLAQNPSATFLDIETGNKFRDFITGPTYTAQLVRDMIAAGKLPPAFLGVHMWSHQIMEEYDGKSTVFIDGTPRVADEVPLLLSAAEFYGWTIEVVYLAVSDAWAHERLAGRGREDDGHEEAVGGRIAWFHTSVEPAIELLKQSPLVHFHEINGEQTIEQVHQDIISRLDLEV